MNSKSSATLAGATSCAESAHIVCLNASQYALAVGMSSEIARAKTRAMWKGSQIGGCSGLLASKERVVLASCAKRMNLKTFARGSDGIGKDARRVCGGSAAMGTTGTRGRSSDARQPHGCLNQICRDHASGSCRSSESIIYNLTRRI